MTNYFTADYTLLTPNTSGPAAHVRHLIVLHTFEGNPDISHIDMARYQSQPAAGGSYHLVIDKSGRTAREVNDSHVSWSAMKMGNRHGYHISLAGRASFTRKQWLARAAQLNTLAEVLAAYSTGAGIPLIKRTGADVRAVKWGVCGHADIRDAWKETDHWDPGPNFPWDHVLTIANQLARTSKETPMSDTRPSLVPGSSASFDQFDYIRHIDRKVEDLHKLVPTILDHLADIKYLIDD